MPTVVVTVWMCLEELAGTCSDCNVLAHAATGGVGLVAIQFAQHAGARVCGTAGSVTKRAYVQWAGVSMVSTTRESLVFDGEMGSILGIEGQLGVMLNSLSRQEYTPAVGARLLGRGGWFVEIGKREICSRDKLAIQLHCRPQFARLVI